MNTPQLRDSCASKLESAAPHISQIQAFVGLDGFVDEIIHVVDKRADSEKYERLPTIKRLAERIAAAAGKSTNIELVTKLIKLGGNGPIMANALASLGIRVTYLGALGYPDLHPVFKKFAQKADVFSVAEAAHTDALEFEDGKLMLGKMVPLNEMTWTNIQDRFGREKFAAHFGGSQLVAFVNWTMIPHMSRIWESLLAELCPSLAGPKRKLFFDLADPEKRTPADIRHALALIEKFGSYFDVILGVNEKEACEIAKAIGIPVRPLTPEGVSGMALEMASKISVNTLVVHPVRYALAVSGGLVEVVEGPLVEKPVITTGAGDHFNSGFCTGKLLGLSNAESLLCGVSTSGYYVRTAQSPSVLQLAALMRDWPASA
jgi:sugar/nucleoside kinase (ribokinase family)